VRDFGRVVFDGSYELAGLEVGSLPDQSLVGLAHSNSLSPTQARTIS
jgi:hypothetical protein